MSANLPYVILLTDQAGTISYRPALMTHQEYLSFKPHTEASGLTVVGAIPRMKLQEMMDDVDEFQERLTSKNE